MKISDIFKSHSFEETGRASSNAAERSLKDGARQAEQFGHGEDSVTISTAARQFAQVSKVISADDDARAARVARLKSEVDSGSYFVSSDEVSRSVVDFLSDQA